MYTSDDLKDIADAFDVEENLRKKMEEAEDPETREYYRLELEALEKKNNEKMIDAFGAFF